MVTFRGFVNGQRYLMLGGAVEGFSGAVQIHRKGYTKNIQGISLQLDLADSPELRAKIAAVPG